MFEDDLLQCEVATFQLCKSFSYASFTPSHFHSSFSPGTYQPLRHNQSMYKQQRVLLLLTPPPPPAFSKTSKRSQTGSRMKSAHAGHFYAVWDTDVPHKNDMPDISSIHITLLHITSTHKFASFGVKCTSGLEGDCIIQIPALIYSDKNFL